MKITIRILATVAIAGLIAVVAIGDAGAVCPNPRLFGTIDTDTGTYTYIDLPAGADNQSVIGRFWQADNRAAGNEGSYDDSIWLIPYEGRWYISGDLGGAGVFGCVNGPMIVTLENNDGSFTSWQAVDTPALSLWWNLAPFGDKTLTPIVRPSLSNRSPAGTQVTFNVTAPGPADGVGGYRLMQRRLAAQADPGRSPANYTPRDIIAPGATVPVTIDCSVQDQVYLGFQVAYGTGTGQFFGDNVGGTANVSCDPNMADPNREFKIIDKPVVRPKRER